VIDRGEAFDTPSLYCPFS